MIKYFLGSIIGILITLIIVNSLIFKRLNDCNTEVLNLKPTEIFDFYNVPKEHRKNLIFSRNEGLGFVSYYMLGCILK